MSLSGAWRVLAGDSELRRLLIVEMVRLGLRGRYSTGVLLYLLNLVLLVSVELISGLPVLALSVVLVHHQLLLVDILRLPHRHVLVADDLHGFGHVFIDEFTRYWVCH